VPEIKTTNVSVNWTSTQAFAVALISLLLGLAGGWFIRKSFVPAPSATAVVPPAAPAGNPPPAPLGPLTALPTPDQIKKMADMQAAPLLESLKSDPNNPDLLARIGNIYYDVKQYPGGHRILRTLLEAPACERRRAHGHGHRVLV